jgi:hypothetical protein
VAAATLRDRSTRGLPCSGRGSGQRRSARPVDPGASEDDAAIGALDENPTRVTWLFVKVAGRKLSTTSFHPDLTSPDWEAEADRLVALGATRQGAFEVDGVRWIALTDPEGNKFNIFAPRPADQHQQVTCTARLTHTDHHRHYPNMLRPVQLTAYPIRSFAPPGAATRH